MKPSWDDAPEWVRWLTKDETGGWQWHECEPEKKWAGDGASYIGWWDSDGRSAYVDQYVDWEDSLEQRPISKQRTSDYEKEGEGMNKPLNLEPTPRMAGNIDSSGRRIINIRCLNNQGCIGCAYCSGLEKYCPLVDYIYHCHWARIAYENNFKHVTKVWLMNKEAERR